MGSSVASGDGAIRKVAIVVPLSARPELRPEEELSLRHLSHFLGRVRQVSGGARRVEIQSRWISHASVSPQVLRFGRGAQSLAHVATLLPHVCELRGTFSSTISTAWFSRTT